MELHVKNVVSELRPALERIYGKRLRKLVIYGSHARGDAVPESDIDVLVVLEGPVQPGIEIARTGAVTATLSLQRNVVISCVFVSEDRYNNEQSPLLINVRREGIPA